MTGYSAVMQTFFAESCTLLEQMESMLAHLQSEPGDAEAINAIFRAVHTTKGSAGLFGLQAIVGFTHEVETLLDEARRGALRIEPDLVALLLQCRDHLERLLDAATAGHEPAADVLEDDARLVRALRARMPTAEGDAPALPVPGAGPLRRHARRAEGETWHLSARFGPDLFRKGLSPLPVLRHLATLGDIAYVATLTDALPAEPDMDPESCYLGLEVRLRSGAGKAAIEDAFEFVADDCVLRILPPDSAVDDYLRLIEELPGDRTRLGDILVDCGAVTARELSRLLELQEARRGGTRAAPFVGELAVQQHAATPEVVSAALGKQREARTHQAREAQLVRVQAQKLDGLIDRVGELVIASAGVGLLAARTGDAPLAEAVSGMARLVEDIRDDAMRLRMVAIGETFNRFRRLVREVSRELGKDIDLVVEGADTELDKALVERIADPLTHLVRNAIDHGIEPAAERLARGKPTRGQVRLAARHAAGHVVVEVADDGGGLDRDRILERARSRGLLAPGAEPTDAQAWNFIFMPGFSTAAQVTDLSGRGVGMDVVRGSIEALRGSVEIDSVAGRGTCFRIHLPLTLAIIDGFLMGVGGSAFVAPLEAVVECVELPDGDDTGWINLRGEVLPLLHLRDHFGLVAPPARRRSVVVVSHPGLKAGLVVDSLEGERQAVIKPMGRLFSRLAGIAGTTILGSGDVALVLDIPGLLSGAVDGARADGHITP